MNVAVKTEALSIFALLLSASGGFLPLDKDLSWTSPKFPPEVPPKFPSPRLPDVLPCASRGEAWSLLQPRTRHHCPPRSDSGQLTAPNGLVVLTRHADPGSAELDRRRSAT